MRRTVFGWVDAPGNEGETVGWVEWTRAFKRFQPIFGSMAPQELLHYCKDCERLYESAEKHEDHETTTALDSPTVA